MKVKLIASTTFTVDDAADVFDETEWSPAFPDTSSDSLAEFAGRACYQSFDRPNHKTATNDGYLANILKQKHESVLEHASATFYIEGVSRYLTHELVRHRHLSFSQLSTRYVSGAQPVRHPGMDDFEWQLYQESFRRQAKYYETIVEDMLSRGMKRKEAREAARSFLPGGLETKVVVTGNHRAWRDVLKKRWHVAADAEIRLLAGELLTALRGIAPNTYQDVPETPYT